TDSAGEPDVTALIARTTNSNIFSRADTPTRVRDAGGRDLTPFPFRAGQPLHTHGSRPGHPRRLRLFDPPPGPVSIRSMSDGNVGARRRDHPGLGSNSRQPGAMPTDRVRLSGARHRLHSVAPLGPENVLPVHGGDDPHRPGSSKRVRRAW